MTARLERRYRRLLWAYPGAYRRVHGSEILATLLDMAEAGHSRPGAAQKLHLVFSGLRQRFRLPTGRPLAWVAATGVWPREAAAGRPLTIVGLIAGALAGWLLAAVLAYRVRGSARPRRWVATGLSAMAFATVAGPVYVHYRDTYQVMVYAPGSPYPYIVYSPVEMPVLTYTVIGLLAVVAALVAARPGREPATVPVTG